LNNSFIRSKKIKKYQIFIKKELDQPQPSDIIFHESTTCSVFH